MRPFIWVLGICALFHGTIATPLEFHIRTDWDGTPITTHEPAKVTLSKTSNGQLNVTVEANFFNTPFPEEPLIEGTCPQRTLYNLYNYEVVEAFFLNDLNEYLELEFSPRGRYLILLLDGYRNTLLSKLPLFPDGVSYLNSPCQDKSWTSCGHRWQASMTVPTEYLPRNFNRFNAYAIHAEDYGVGKVESDKIHYESLFPADPKVQKNADFHYLDGFKEVDLKTLDFKPPTELSPLWKAAREDAQPFVFKHAIKYAHEDCSATSESESYACNVTTHKQKDGLNILIRDRKSVV